MASKVADQWSYTHDIRTNEDDTIYLNERKSIEMASKVADQWSYTHDIRTNEDDTIYLNELCVPSYDQRIQLAIRSMIENEIKPVRYK